ncbi:unnamed protein product [Cuscuta campestris]|uniref:Mannosyl-oligosaccharide glucosidase n=1 Tax=Cuscuta campestris TaxID=132261 RepID=A0A484L5L2_9ASTE|nr:unnamed protein product [Cuscuta campestris]
MTGNSSRNARSRPKLRPGVEEEREAGSATLNSKLRRKRGKDQSSIIFPGVNLKYLLGFGSISFLIALFLIYRFANLDGVPPKPRVITPLPAPKLMDLPMFQGEHKESLYWGTYRPQVYFGIRARSPQSLVFGLMWIAAKDGRFFMRHVCQDSDELKTYGWTKHNGRDYGHQHLADHMMTLTTSFLKSKAKGSGYGGDWAARFEAKVDESVVDEEMLKKVNLFFYMADEGGNALTLGEGAIDTNHESTIALGSHSDVGGWELHLKSEDYFGIHYSGFKTPHIHNLSDLVQENLGVKARKAGVLQLSDTLDDSSNIIVFQISAMLSLKADIVFVSGTELQDSRVEERLSNLRGNSLSSLLNEKQKEFDDKFKRCYNVSDQLDSGSLTVGRDALAQTLGGIGYFYGQTKIALPKASRVDMEEKYLLYWPAELYSAVPSRPFFPRGFLWDEGFHQLIIWQWDTYISLDIIGHWLDLMNIDGWIPREQILGAEALSKVPQEFVPQHPTNGNPPTLFLALRDLICGIKKNKFSAAERNDISIFLDSALIRLETWFNWFNTTQSGKGFGSYFWHGRDSTTTRELNPKTLSSGLDDYPRASHPDEDERHLDLRCWMFLAADCMHSITKLLKRESKHQDYGLTAKLLSDFELLNKMHFDSSSAAYFDYGNHTEKVRLSWQIVGSGSNHPNRELLREVLDKPVLKLVPHAGYVSLFPLMAKLIPPGSWILEKQLDLISNKSTLWTDFGLRSLAKTSSMYMKRNTEHDPPYWRGAIWMQFNYMTLGALHHYSREPGPYRERAKTIYQELRSNLIRNVVQNYHRTGYLWEQYDPKNGKGKGARFTGWTALVLLIMSETYNEC